MLKHLLLILSLLPTTILWAQQDLNTNFHKGTWQSNRTNPAFFPSEKVVVGLPGVYASIWLSGLRYGDIISKNDNGQPLLDIDRAISLMDEQNLIRQQTEVETFSLGLRFGRLGVGLGHALRFNAFAGYPKTLPQLIWQGNAQFIGEEVAFGPDLQLSALSEMYLGFGYEIIPQLTLGGRAKFWSGLADASTPNTQLNLFTDPNGFDLRLDADFQANLTGNASFDGFDTPSVDLQWGEFAMDQFFSENRGWAFDVGAAWKAPKFDVAISVIDIGSIYWKDNARSYSLRGTFEYKGLDVLDGIFEDSTDWSTVLDSLETLYQPVEEIAPYRTRMPARLYFTAGWQIAPKWRVGSVFYAEKYRNRNFYAASLNASADVFSWWTLGASWGVRNQRFDQIGIFSSMRLGPVQLIASSDNLAGALWLKNSQTTNLRLGLNLVFGQPDKRHIELPTNPLIDNE
jgi:hypothetical protein